MTVYDLNINKYEPLCEQAVVSKKKAKLTHIAFNPFEPILIVGDDRYSFMLYWLFNKNFEFISSSIHNGF